MIGEGNAYTVKPEFETTLKELTQLAEKFPSRKLYEQIAQCYRQLDETQEAEIILDMARFMPQKSTPAPEHFT